MDSINILIVKLNQYISNQVRLDKEENSEIQLFSFSKILDNKPIFSGCFTFHLDMDNINSAIHVNILPQNNKTLILMTTDDKLKSADFLRQLQKCENQEIIAVVSGLISSYGTNLYFSKKHIESHTNEELVEFMNEWRADKELSKYLEYPDPNLDNEKIKIINHCNKISNILFSSV